MDPQAAWLEQLDGADAFVSWVAERVRPFVRGRTLEVGCGTGTYTSRLAAWADRVLAIDINAQFVAAARSRLAPCSNVRVEVADATRLSVAGSFDTIVMLDVLEHIADDRDMVDRLSRLLAEGGRLVLKIPAGGWLYGSLDRAIGHYRRYDPAGLRRLAAAAGLVLEHCGYFNMAAVPGWWLNGRVLRRTAPPAAQLALFNCLVPALARAEGLIGPPFGVSLIASAKQARHVAGARHVA
jgi:SAM-dependent methyltransferase